MGIILALEKQKKSTKTNQEQLWGARPLERLD
jgi:hypothetical protein